MQQSVDKILLNPQALAPKFAEQQLFHEAQTAIEVLGLEDIPAGDSLLDLGCGKKILCNTLTARGIKAIGLDVATIDDSQQPDIIGTSDNIPLPDNSIDHVVSFWGGLAYPIEDLATIGELEPDIEKKIVTTFLTQLKEALRVARIDTRINPWSVTGLYEAAGVKTITADSYDGLSILAINFNKLFSDMGINTHTGEIYNQGEFPENWKIESLVLQKTDRYTSKPLDELIERINVTDKPMQINEFDIRAVEQEDQPISRCLSALKAWQGSVNYARKRAEWASDPQPDNRLFLDYNQEKIAKNNLGYTNQTLKHLTQAEIQSVILQTCQYTIDRGLPHIAEEKEKLHNLLGTFLANKFIN